MNELAVAFLPFLCGLELISHGVSDVVQLHVAIGPGDICVCDDLCVVWIDFIRELITRPRRVNRTAAAKPESRSESPEHADATSIPVRHLISHCRHVGHGCSIPSSLFCLPDVVHLAVAV